MIFLIYILYLIQSFVTHCRGNQKIQNFISLLKFIIIYTSTCELRRSSLHTTIPFFIIHILCIWFHCLTLGGTGMAF